MIDTVASASPLSDGSIERTALMASPNVGAYPSSP
jgi:hypothetical protein